MTNNMYITKSPKDIKPKDYLIIEWRTVSTPGWEKDDPPGLEVVQEVSRTTDKIIWLKQIEQIEKENLTRYTKREYCALQVSSVAETKISIDIKDI